MKKNNEIYILKLGGSLITDKSRPLSLRVNVIENAIHQIVESKKKIILIHGGGSFGHPIAKKYDLFDGMNKSIENQLLGLAETHEAMNHLNSILIEKMLKYNLPVVSFQASSIFIKKSDQLILESSKPIETAVNLGILPVLYGDILFGSKDSFSIISGDKIILELCKKLQTFSILKVIFVIEEDGIFIKENVNNMETIKLACKLNSNELHQIKLAELEQKIDVTGGIRGKLEIIKKISDLDIPVQIINGLKDDYILKALNNEDFECSEIKPPERDKFVEIKQRKMEHLEIPIKYNVQHSENYFKDIKLIHHSLPEIIFDEIDLSTDFFNKKVSAPICIAAITGGNPISKNINKILATAAEKENIIMSVGSQRIALEDPSTQDSFSIIREVAPNIPVIGNIGIAQISDPNFILEDFGKCIQMVKADVMAIHFNALHELVQDKGNITYERFQSNFNTLRRNYKIPIIAKEVGTGFNKEIAQTLDDLNFNGFDVGGAGGTSFAAIESYRNQKLEEKYTRNPTDLFREWGIPTPISILNIRKITKRTIIATGGLRTGQDIAKSLILGADIGGFAYNFLISAWKDYKEKTISHTIKEIRTLKNELRSCLWLMNINNVDNLKNRTDKRVFLGNLYQWINQ